MKGAGRKLLGVYRRMRRPIADRFGLSAMLASAMLLLGAIAGCGGGGGGGAPVRAKAKPGPANNSSIIAVDCMRQRAYVPLPDLNDNLHGQIAVLDLSVDPDVANPLMTVIDTGEIALPRSAAVHLESGTVLVLMDNVLDTGVLLLINEADNSISTVPFPAGSRPAENSGVVVDPVTSTALVSMTDSVDGCTSPEIGGCTGEAVFNLATRTFGPLSLSLVEIDAFGLDFDTGISMGTADALLAELLVYNLNSFGPIACLLDEDTLKNLDADPDGTAPDPGTGVWVVGNFESPTATLINLNGATFTGLGTLDCHLNEAGTPPNSVNFDTGTGAEGMPGVAINPQTHQAFMTASEGNQLSLLSLPRKPVTQITAADVSGVKATMPADPLGTAFDSAHFPYGIAIDSCNNLAYVLENDRGFLAQVDLKTMQKHPEVIGTALPAGSCAGVSTTSQCDNGNGVRFFPLPGPPSAAAHRMPPQFRDERYQHRKSVRHN